MRVMVVEPGPHFSVQDVYSGWCSGLHKAGAEVVAYNHGAALDMFQRAFFEDERFAFWHNPWTFEQQMALAGDMLLAHASKTRPDVVLLVFGKFVPLPVIRTLRANGAKVVYLFTESPYEDDMQQNHAGYADLCIVNDPTNLDGFPPSTYYQPHAYDPDRHYPGTGPRTVPFSFVGTGYDSRVEFFEAVDWTGIDGRFEGNWPSVVGESSPLRRFFAHDDLEACIDNAEAADLYRSSQMSANVYRRESNAPELSSGWSCGPREVELAACGTPFLRDPRPESDEVFPMLPSFSGPEDFGEQLKWWLGHDRERERAAYQAWSAIADRTFEQAARRLLDKLER